MSCFNNPGATHHAGCECWEQTRRDQVLEEAIRAIDEAFERNEDIAPQSVLRALMSAPSTLPADVSKKTENVDTLGATTCVHGDVGGCDACKRNARMRGGR